MAVKVDAQTQATVQTPVPALLDRFHLVPKSVLL